jgi:CubicO group peptidase (beta-lactamase class C family)
VRISFDHSLIRGSVAPGFEEVRTEFRSNFTRRGEVGAACAAYLRGEKVVDLWGGWRDLDGRLPWREETLVLIFSATKGMAALALAVAHSRGWLDYEAPVSSYWPEFAQRGKEAITVRQLLAHQAGLCVVEDRLDAGILADFDALAEILARQAPAWKPGRKHGYHAMTLGWYEGELIRRVDPSRRSLGRFFREEIARPLGLEIHIGAPPDLPESRLAVIQDYRPARVLMSMNSLPRPFVVALLNPFSLTHKAVSNPRLHRPADLGLSPYREVEIPAGNGIALARSVARAYGSVAAGGAELGLKPATLELLAAPPVPPEEGSLDEILRVETAYSLGFFRPFPGFRFGSGDGAFGAPGMGGAMGFADPAAQAGFFYAPNRSGFHLWDDPREKALRDAFYRCLGAARGSRG